jgi:predicted nicotinamide N-methyase
MRATGFPGADRARCASTVAGYEVETSTLRIGGDDYRIRALRDRQQYDDADGAAEAAGIGSATWPLFGVVWPSGRALAERMAGFPVAGKRVLEIGCGLALASLVLRRRGADVTASDHHPLAAEFLRHNVALNQLPPVPFQSVEWTAPNEQLGLFDLVIGSDILYERDHPAQVGAFLLRHTQPVAEILVADPGRGRCGQLTRRLAAAGFSMTEQHQRFGPEETPPFRGRIVTYRRS